MPDEVRTQQIEKRIDRDVAGGMLPATTGAFSLLPRDMAQAMEFGKLMAVSGECVRPAFRNNPGACLAIALQAWRDGGDPFAYANHAYIVNNQIAYEAKLVHAIVNTRAPTTGRLRTTYSGDGPKRRCKVIGFLRGETEPFEYESPEVGTIKVKNSPLWQSDPDQQLHYFSVRSWARRHVPEVLLGIYTPDEVQGEIIDMTPAQGAIQEATPAAAPDAPIPWEVTDAAGEVYEFEMSDKAVEACRRILIASAADPALLATAWENNAAFIVSLGQEGLEADAQALERLYSELTPRQETVATENASASAPAPRIEEQGLGATPGTGSNSPAAQQTGKDDAIGLGGPAPAGDADETIVAGGDSVRARQEGRPAREASIVERRPFATTGTEPDGNAGDSGDNGKKAGAGPTATTAASRSKPATDLLGDPPAADFTIPVPRHPQPADLAYAGRQLLALIAEAPMTPQRRAQIKAQNELLILDLKVADVSMYDEIQETLNRRS